MENLNPIIKLTYKREVKRENVARKLEDHKKYMIDKFKSFRISFMKKGVIGENAIESFFIEGIDNAMRIFESYRRIGHSMKLHNLKIERTDGELVKKINFKYIGEKNNSKMNDNIPTGFQDPANVQIQSYEPTQKEFDSLTYNFIDSVRGKYRRFKLALREEDSVRLQAQFIVYEENQFIDFVKDRHGDINRQLIESFINDYFNSYA